MNKLLWDLHKNIRKEAPGGEKFTLFALNKLKLKKNAKVKILNLGCGKGLETIALANNIEGKIIALDAHEPYLDELTLELQKNNLQNKVEVYFDDMREMPFRNNSFDIIWIEGAIHNIGFEEGIKKFKKYIKPDGFLVISDYIYTSDNIPLELKNYFNDIYPTISTIEDNLEIAESNNFKVIDSYILDEDAWWHDYLTPLRIRLTELMKEMTGKESATKLLKERMKDIEMREKYREYYGFAFYILKKKPIKTIFLKNKKISNNSIY